MERHEKKNKPSFLLVNIFSLLLILCFGSLIINNSIKYQKLFKEEEILKKDIINLKTKKTTYENVDKDINNLKNDVYNLSSKLEKSIINEKTTYKIAYLTFDDGPYYNTHKVLDILKKNKVKATFFTIGYKKDSCFDKKDVSCMDLYKKIVDNGHTIANHTYSHAIFNGLYDSTESFIEQVKLQENLIKEKTGIITNIVRFPGGSGTAKNLKEPIIKELRKNGYGWVDWSAEDGDGGYLISKEVAWNKLKRTINDDIEVVLFHDYDLITTDILNDFIEYLRNNNYIILPLFYDSIKVNK